MRNDISAGRPERRRDRGRSRGQVEILGYILVFTIVLAGTIVVVLSGTTALDQVQSATTANNAEFAVQAIASDLEAIHYGTAISRNTELAIRSASLETGSPATLNVTAVKYVDSNFDATDGATSSTVATNANYTYRPIVYSTDDADVVYANTLVIRDQRRGVVAVNDPLLAVDENRAVVPAIETTAPVQSVSGGTRQVNSNFVKSNGTTVTAARNVPADNVSYVAVNLTVTTTPDSATVWGRVLNETLADVPNPTGGPDCRRLRESTVSCQFRTDRLVVSNTTIEYDFR